MPLPTGPLLIVSPHLDDAVMSCSALLERGEPCEILNVFAGFPRPARAGASDLAAGFFDSDEAMTARHAEARNAFSGSHHCVVNMALLADQYLDDRRSDRDRRWIQRAISDWSVRNGGGTIAIPAAAGQAPGRGWSARRRGPTQDPDHVVVREAALDVLGLLPRAKVWIYEEYQHCGAAGADSAIRGLRGRRRLDTARVALGVNRREKVRVAALFRSERINRPRDFGVDSLAKAERYWRVGV